MDRYTCWNEENIWTEENFGELRKIFDELGKLKKTEIKPALKFFEKSEIKIVFKLIKTDYIILIKYNSSGLKQ